MSFITKQIIAVSAESIFLLAVAAGVLGQVAAIPEGHMIVDGDMIMLVEQFTAMTTRRTSTDMSPESAVTFLTWPNGIVRYMFQDPCGPTSTCTNAPSGGCVSAANRTAMQAAMATVEAAANIDFQQCLSNGCFIEDGSFVFIRDSTNDTNPNPDNSCQDTSGNSAAIGWRPSSLRPVNITSWNSHFIIVHELLHALGIYHEHQRSDRNTFVTVNCGSVIGGCNGNNFLTHFAVDSNGVAYGAYDFDSVMHYGQCSFSNAADCPTTGVTINVNTPWTAQWQAAIGQRTHISSLDQLTLSFLYPPANWKFVDCAYGGVNGPSNGSFGRPHTTIAAALAVAPPGGTIWVLRNCTFPAGNYNNNVTIRTAPGVTATFGG